MRVGVGGRRQAGSQLWHAGSVMAPGNLLARESVPWGQLVSMKLPVAQSCTAQLLREEQSPTPEGAAGSELPGEALMRLSCLQAEMQELLLEEMQEMQEGSHGPPSQQEHRINTENKAKIRMAGTNLGHSHGL